MGLLRVLMISKACLVGAYRRKLVELAQDSEIELRVVVPPSWREGHNITRLERTETVGYELVVEPLLFNGNFHLHMYPRLMRQISGFAPDIVHVDEEPYNLATFHAMRLARRHGARALWFSWQNLNRTYPAPFRWIERYNLAHADHAIVGSVGAADVWRAKGYSGPLAVIPQFGVAPDVFTPRPGGPSYTTDRLVIGYAGRLVPEKGIDTLIQAVAGLAGDWQLVILGDGPERPRLEQLVRQLGLWMCVSFANWRSSMDMPGFFRSLDLLVLPSRSRPNWVEQFGRVLVEAMASGVVVVGSDCGEIPTVIGDAGLVFPEGDASALRNHLSRLMQSADLRADLAQRGRARVLAHFTQARIAEQTAKVYRALMAGCPPPRT